MASNTGINRIIQVWGDYCLQLTGRTYKEMLRERARTIKKKLDDIENESDSKTEEDELEEENRCGQLSHGEDGRWVSMDKEDGSLTYPQKPGCNGGKQYKRTGKAPGANMTPCGARDRSRKCKG